MAQPIKEGRSSLVQIDAPLEAMTWLYAMQHHHIPIELYRQDTAPKVFQEIYWYILYRNSASSKRSFLRLEALLPQTHSGIPVCDNKAQMASVL